MLLKPLFLSIFAVNSNRHIFALFLTFLFPQIIFSQYVTPNPPPAVNSVTLELNKPVEREMSGKPRHNYKITLVAGQYVKIILDQRGIDIGARIYGPDNKRIFDVDGEFSLNKPEIIEFVPKTDGEYRLDVMNKFPLAAAGSYEIQIVESHPATASEIVQQQARNDYGEAALDIDAGKYVEARKAIERALESDLKEFGAENLTVVSDSNYLGRILYHLGEYEEAVKIGERVLTARSQSAEPDHYRFGITLLQLGDSYGSLEDYPKSIEYYRQALEIFRKVLGDASQPVAAALINLGEVYKLLGDNQKALENYQTALDYQEKSAKPEDYNTASVLVSIGEVYTEQKEYAKAEPVLLRAIKILETMYQKDNPLTLPALSGLAVYYTKTRNYDRAEELFKRISAISEKSLTPNHPTNAANDFNLANLYVLKNEFEKAEPLYRRALEIREKNFGVDGAPVSEILIALASLVARKGDVQQSLKLQQRANAIDERSINLNLTVGSERQKLAYLNSLFEHTNQSIRLQTKYAPDDELAVELAATTVLRQKGRVLDALADNLSELRRRSAPQDAELIDNFNKITKQIATLSLDKPDDAPPAEYLQKIKKLTDDREKIEDDISRRAAGYFPDSAPVTLAAVQSVIPAGSALVEFAVYTPAAAASDENASDKNRYAVYVIHNQGEVKWKDLGDAADINQMIDALRQALRDPKRTDVQTLARRADEKIMQPVRALLGDSKHLLVSPDGELNLIPFEALADENNRWLIENYSLTYLSSGRDLLRLQTARASKSKSLLIAAPQFGETVPETIAAISKTRKRSTKRQSVTATRNMSDTYFAPLGGTLQEARSIQNLFPDALFLTGAQATETALKKANAPEILHIATHGFFLEDENILNGKNKSAAAARDAQTKIETENPLLRSGLALAGANRRTSGAGDDGILTALEASGLSLWGTKLVVLSACDTGLGEIKNGEGVYGLRRAFALAGTESLVMSLWSVSDQVTRELMTDYYKNLKQDSGRGASLRQVQLAMMKRKGREHPFYWAGFIQSGEWANLDGKR